MSQAHKEALMRKHDELEREIHEKRCHTSCDTLEIERLKRERLHIKEVCEGIR